MAIAQHRHFVTLIRTVSLISLLLVGLGDYLTGFEVNFFVFYAIPIGLLTWYDSRRSGFIAVILCIFVWFFIDNMTSYQYSHPLIPYWNGLIRRSRPVLSPGKCG